MTCSAPAQLLSRRRRKMTAPTCWYIVACLLVIVLSSLPLVSAGDASPQSAPTPQSPSSSAISLTDVIQTNDNEREDDEEDEIEVEGQQDADIDEGEPPEPSPPGAKGDGEAPTESPPTDDGDTPPPTPDDNETDSPSPTPDDNGDGDTPAPTPNEGGDEPSTTDEPPVDAPSVPPPTAAVEDEPSPEPTRTPQETESPAPSPDPEASPEPSQQETDPPEPSPGPTESPPDTEMPTQADNPEPEPTPDESTTSPQPTSSPTEIENEETPAPVDEPEEESSQPSVYPTEYPSKSPSVEPESSRPTLGMITLAPTKSPVSPFPSHSPSAAPTLSLQPTSAPTPMPNPSIAIEDNVSVIIGPVSSTMSAGNAEHFQATAMTFLSELLIQLEQPIYDVDVSVTGGNILTRRRRRRLQSDSMQVDMVVSGRFDPVDGLAESAEDYSIGRVARQFFTVQGSTFVRQLQETDNEEGSSYFQEVSSIQSVPDPEDDTAPSGAPPSPGSASTSDNGPGLAIGGIVAVALVGALVVALGAALIVNHMRKRRANNDLSRSQENSFSTKKSSQRSGAKKGKQSGSAKGFGRQKSATSPVSSPEKAMEEQPPPLLSIGGPPSDRGSIRLVDSDVNSDLQWGAESLLGVESNMSYAYSLEDGINQSPSAEQSLSSYVLRNSEKDVEAPDPTQVPTEIPNVSSNRSEDEANDDDDDLDIDKSWTPNSSSIIREITAPAGKLGVVLNTSEKGPVVQSVAAGSPLEGMVWPGDVVVSIDGHKARKMSAAAVNEYMSKNLFKQRKLTMMSDPDA